MQLRPYQQQTKAGILSAFSSGMKAVIMEQPTGGGKTVTFVDMVHGAISKQNITVIIVDRSELLFQAFTKCRDYGLNPTVINAKYRKHVENYCYIASVQTLRNRMKKPVFQEWAKRVKLVIVDEAHKATFKPVKDWFNLSYRIGATATPLSTNAHNLAEHYEKIVPGAKIEELQGMGFLSKAEYYAVGNDFSEVKTKGGDFDPSALFAEMDKSKIYEGLVEVWQRVASRKKTIVFCVNIEHSKKTCEQFVKAGYKAAHLDGATHKDIRTKILADFHDGTIQILCNADLLTTGYDEPSIECVVLNRDTKSLPLYLQMVGRGSRIFPGKKLFTVIDMGGNVKRHNYWHLPRVWSLHPQKKNKGEGLPPLKECKKCFKLHHTTVKICDECGTEFPKPKEEAPEVAKELIKLDSDLPVRLNKPKDKLTLKEWHEIAQHKGFKNGWAYIQFKQYNKLNK